MPWVSVMSCSCRITGALGHYDILLSLPVFFHKLPEVFLGGFGQESLTGGEGVFLRAKSIVGGHLPGWFRGWVGFVRDRNEILYNTPRERCRSGGGAGGSEGETMVSHLCTKTAGSSTETILLGFHQRDLSEETAAGYSVRGVFIQQDS